MANSEGLSWLPTSRLLWRKGEFHSRRSKRCRASACSTPRSRLENRSHLLERSGVTLLAKEAESRLVLILMEEVLMRATEVLLLPVRVHLQALVQVSKA